ncbi:TrpB-like pyridoxal phosphate-dependent enzyme [Thermosphaera chiliense]|uniref:Tryptophan synthase beta chain n=1 Tax=Thermosphaera chiliense TaxID=3402707 RepID=A0A7M1USA0_9CREN|nr:TrpB-like pyridoxal phosphate-dependent enzyme [Thermosphaera aggregans]QOR95165.1 TrpB-like pyridoxal phosphate-dependent enzyme [Thermosphaera aggregans]
MVLKAPQDSSIIPTQWYNIIPDLPENLPPPILPNGQVAGPEILEEIFPRELVRQEVSSERYIKIPDEILQNYAQAGRPTPLIRARNLEIALKTSARIFFKYEGVLPAGSHKFNTAVAQAYYNMREGVDRLCTETGAGQWGSALSLAGSLFGIKIRVYMVRASYNQKPLRRILMETYGAEVHPSPSSLTRVGRKYLEENPNHPGSLGIAISEAIEDVLSSNGTAKYSLGSVLNHVLLHQTVIGMEALKQLESIGIGVEEVSHVVGCVGGGSNFAGLSYPFIQYKLSGRANTVFIAVEPKAVPSMTMGEYKYDYGDSAGLTPMLKMHTLGHDYVPPPIHAGGLRYHGVAPTLSVLVKNGIVNPIAYSQREVFEAGVLFARTQGIVPAPESAHAVKAVIDIARRYTKGYEKPVILFNLSGHGLLDLAGYSEYLNGRLQDT